MRNNLLEIDGLELDIRVGDDDRHLLQGVSLSVDPGEALGLVGESGSGKSLTARSVIRLLPSTGVVTGDIRFEGRSIPGMSASELRRFRASDVAMIFQDPRAHINPIRTIGDFLIEGVTVTQGVNRRDASARARKQLDEVGIADASRRMKQQPHELSGGLLQRVMIASALMIEPRLLLADEPTTALDVTTQEEVMAILDELRRDRGLAMVFITHDLDLAAAVCDRISVMKEGRIVEELSAEEIYEQASDPYTVSLLQARVPFNVEAYHPVHRDDQLGGQPWSGAAS